VELSAVFFPQALSNDAPLQDLGLFSILKSYGVTHHEHSPSVFEGELPGASAMEATVLSCGMNIKYPLIELSPAR